MSILMLDNKIGGGFSNSIFHNHLCPKFLLLKKIISIIFHFFYYLISDKKKKNYFFI